MTTTNGWPGKPGVPLNPEQDGWHWLKRISNGWETLAKWDNDWNGNDDFWWNLPEYSDPEKVAKIFCYLGPCLTPDEATALQARADRNAAGFARVDAEAERAKFLHKQEIATLQKRCEEAERTAIQAAECHARETRRADALQKRVAELEKALITAQNMLSEMGISSAEKCQMAYDYLREANAALGGKDE